MGRIARRKQPEVDPTINGYHPHMLFFSGAPWSKVGHLRNHAHAVYNSSTTFGRRGRGTYHLGMKIVVLQLGRARFARFGNLVLRCQNIEKFKGIYSGCSLLTALEVSLFSLQAVKP